MNQDYLDKLVECVNAVAKKKANTCLTFEETLADYIVARSLLKTGFGLNVEEFVAVDGIADKAQVHVQRVDRVEGLPN